MSRSRSGRPATPTRIDRLFRRSGLFRETCNGVHYSDGLTHGETAIRRAIEHTTDGYDPERAHSKTGTDVRSEGHDHATREKRYTQERVRLPEPRPAEVEALLERKTERIATLEAAIDAAGENDRDGSEPTDADDTGLRDVTRRLLAVRQ